MSSTYHGQTVANSETIAVDLRPIESSGHKPTDQERALKGIETALLRIRRECDAALTSLNELKGMKNV